ncbi:MAG: hypothetical protein CMD25_00315 [Flavobacteriales bacterium]|nr:hypothetical protein [Flavobacteriales bacterium]
MADLEKNLEQAIEEALQPDSKAEKGDSKPVKQGSSDAAKIESGKGEVVKPEENPVDKAVASVKSAEKGTKEVSGDPQQKGEAAPEKQPKLKKVSEDDVKEEQKPSKMDVIKAAVNKMKDMSKDELQAMYNSMSKKDDVEDSEEVDESLTKAEIARNIVEMLKGMDEESVQDFTNSLNEEDDKEEDEDEDEKEVKEEDEKDKDEDEDDEEEVKESKVESDLIEMEIEDDLEAISEALELSEENADKARTIFKAAVSSKVSEIKEQLDNEYSNNLKTSVEKVKGDLAEAVDKYLSYCAEEWTKENELAIERGLRSEMTDNFIEGLKTLFVEHYVEVPEDKYDVIDELANRLDEMEEKLDSEVHKNMEIVEENESLKRQNVVREACVDLSESQKEKMISLSEGVDYKDSEDFAEKVSELKEAYFPSDEVIAEETVVEEGTGEFSTESESVIDPTMNQYSNAISKLKPLG